MGWRRKWRCASAMSVLALDPFFFPVSALPSDVTMFPIILIGWKKPRAFVSYTHPWVYLWGQFLKWITEEEDYPECKQHHPKQPDSETEYIWKGKASCMPARTNTSPLKLINHKDKNSKTWGNHFFSPHPRTVFLLFASGLKAMGLVDLREKLWSVSQNFPPLLWLSVTVTESKDFRAHYAGSSLAKCS